LPPELAAEQCAYDKMFEETTYGEPVLQKEYSVDIPLDVPPGEEPPDDKPYDDGKFGDQDDSTPPKREYSDPGKLCEKCPDLKTEVCVDLPRVLAQTKEEANRLARQIGQKILSEKMVSECPHSWISLSCNDVYVGGGVDPFIEIAAPYPVKVEGVYWKSNIQARSGTQLGVYVKRVPGAIYCVVPTSVVLTPGYIEGTVVAEDALRRTVHHPFKFGFYCPRIYDQKGRSLWLADYSGILLYKDTTKIFIEVPSQSVIQTLGVTYARQADESLFVIDDVTQIGSALQLYWRPYLYTVDGTKIDGALLCGPTCGVGISVTRAPTVEKYMNWVSEYSQALVLIDRSHIIRRPIIKGVLRECPGIVKELDVEWECKDISGAGQIGYVIRSRELCYPIEP